MLTKGFVVLKEMMLKVIHLIVQAGEEIVRRYNGISNEWEYLTLDG